MDFEMKTVTLEILRKNVRWS